MILDEEYKWYPLRVTYNREIKVKQALDSLKIKNFLPMKNKKILRGERLIKIKVAAIHNLIFVYMPLKRLHELKTSSTLPIRYIMNRESGQPIIVPDNQMKNFIAVAGAIDEQIVYLDPNISNFTKGDKVRIVGGIFEGTEGYFMRIKGDRRVVVCLHGLAAVATAFIHPNFVEKISGE